VCARLRTSLPKRTGPTWNISTQLQLRGVPVTTRCNLEGSQRPSYRGVCLPEFLIDLASPTFFLGGPEGFMNNARQILSTLGVIRTESFRKVLGRANRPLSLVHRKPVQSRLSCFFTRKRFARLPPEARCWIWEGETASKFRLAAAQGQCGTCATRVLSGNVQMDVEAGLTAEQKKCRICTALCEPG
jgi:hypothetical protein